jgi:hypothetical protein
MSRMVSLNLGSAQSISDKMRDIIESPGYMAAASKAAFETEIAIENHPVVSNFHLSIKRGIFGFLRRRNAENRPTSQLNPNGHFAALHPLVSIYYLTREKMEREQEAMQDASTLHEPSRAASETNTFIDHWIRLFRERLSKHIRK